jgi:hypothetical protein
VTYDEPRSVGESLKGIATLLGVPFREGKDTFGRPFLDITVDGMQLILEVALKLGYHEVAQDIRQMLVRGERREMGM